MDQVDTSQKKQRDYNDEALKELAKINLTNGDLLGNVSATLLRSAQKATTDDVKQKILTKFHSTLSKFTAQNVQQELLAKLNNEQLPIFFDFVNYSFELLSKGIKLSEQCSSYNSTFLLVVYNKLVELKGLPIIIESISQKKTLPTQIITIK